MSRGIGWLAECRVLTAECFTPAKMHLVSMSQFEARIKEVGIGYV
jgi:hypothetical protein